MAQDIVHEAANGRVEIGLSAAGQDLRPLDEIGHFILRLVLF